MKMMTLFTHVIPNLYDFLSSVEHNQEMLNNAELRLSLYEKKRFYRFETTWSM